VHAGATKHEQIIDLVDCHRVSLEFFDKNRRFALRKGDVVLNRAGEGTIGKSGLFTSEERAVFSDFTMRLRFGATMNPRFAWYYFRSIIFQTQVEREKRGMGNMTNIFPSQVERMLIPHCKRDHQDSVVAQIDTELDKLTWARKTIQDKQREIEDFISHTIECS
ncbi:MAG TPA: hypothetical protein VJT69_09435, partial [Pyrinomonadaceae bacterium]|nr:hypothetical protein [Pyrinomonadaceae bacterium]